MLILVEFSGKKMLFAFDFATLVKSDVFIKLRNTTFSCEKRMIFHTNKK